jgi:hypothetical protein
VRIVVLVRHIAELRSAASLHTLYSEARFLGQSLPADRRPWGAPSVHGPSGEASCQTTLRLLSIGAFLPLGWPEAKLKT